MARIRTIKPEFPQSETVGSLSRDARLLFLQLFTIADDEGRARAASRMLASLLYPYDDDARTLIDGWLDELEAAGCIRRYKVDGDSYLDIPNWLKHQKIDHPSKSRIPEFREDLANPREDSRSLAPDLGPRTSTKDLVPTIGRSPKATRPSDNQFEEFWKAYPRRQGANPKSPARKLFDTAVKQGATPSEIIEGARRCAAADSEKIGTPYIPQAVKWLRDKRWQDYPPIAEPGQGPPVPPNPNLPSDAELRAKYGTKIHGRQDASEGSGLRRESNRLLQADDAGPHEGRGDIPDHQARQRGMERLGAIFPGASWVRAAGHEAGALGNATIDDGPEPVARMVRQ